MHFSDVIFQVPKRPLPHVALVTLERQCVTVHVIFQVSPQQECLSTFLTRVLSAVRMPKDVCFVSFVHVEALATMRTYQLFLFRMCFRDVRVHATLRHKHLLTLIAFNSFVTVLLPLMVEPSPV